LAPKPEQRHSGRSEAEIRNPGKEDPLPGSAFAGMTMEDLKSLSEEDKQRTLKSPPKVRLDAAEYRSGLRIKRKGV
jgi:hypothetical protein